MPQHTQERYLIRREAGRGKRAIVQEAYDTLLNRPVALKVGLDDLGKRFLLEEAQRLARVRHPHVITLYDYITEGQTCLVLEWLTGQTMRARLSQPPHVPLETIIAWMTQLLRALDAAHRVDVLHGDIKPENIWIDPAQQLKVFDFGMSPRAGGDATALYASPEVLQGQAPTPSSDVYCVGSVLFELLTGHPPFDGSDTDELAVRKAGRKAPLVARSGGNAPEPLETWLVRALERDPAQRFENATIAREEWQRAVAGLKITTPHATSSAALHTQTSNRLSQYFPVDGSQAGTVITLAGGSGQGKTELLQQVLLAHKNRQNTIVLRGAGDQQTAFSSWLSASHGTTATHLDLDRIETLALQVQQHLAVRQQPNELLVIVDDYAECDPQTRDLLNRLAQQATGLRLGMLLSTNDKLLGAARADWCELQDVATECLAIPTVQAAALRRVLATQLHGAEVHDDLYAYIEGLTANNPRYATHLFADLQHGGYLQPIGQNWRFDVPDEDLLPQRSVPYLEQSLSVLDDTQRILLVEAALHGRRFSPKRLAERLQLPAAEIAQQLHDISRKADLIEADAEAFHFTIPLLQIHLENSIAMPLRSQAHNKISDLLLRDEAADGGNLGIHLFRADRLEEARVYLNAAGRNALQEHKTESARRNLYLALQTFTSEPASEEAAQSLADLLLLYAQALLQLASWDSANEHLGRCLLLSQGWGLQKQEVQAIRTRGHIHYKRGHFSEAITTLREAQQCATRYEDTTEVHELAMQIGNLDFERGNLDTALAGYMSALLFAAEQNDPELEARASNNVALIHSTQGDKPEAIRMFSRSLQLFKKLRREDAVARTQHNIGMTYLELHNWAEARNYFQESIDAAAKIGLDEILAVARLEHAETNLRLGRLNEAKPEIDSALALCQQRNDPLGTATAYRLLGMVAAQSGDLELAETHLGRSIKQLRDLGETPHLGLALKELGRVRLEAGKIAAALQTLEEARSIFSALETPHEGLSEVNTLWEVCQNKLKQNA